MRLERTRTAASATIALPVTHADVKRVTVRAFHSFAGAFLTAGHGGGAYRGWDKFQVPVNARPPLPTHPGIFIPIPHFPAPRRTVIGHFSPHSHALTDQPSHLTPLYANPHSNSASSHAPTYGS